MAGNTVCVYRYSETVTSAVVKGGSPAPAMAGHGRADDSSAANRDATSDAHNNREQNVAQYSGDGALTPLPARHFMYL